MAKSESGELEKRLTNCLYFLAKGLVTWENTNPLSRCEVPSSLRQGMSILYAIYLEEGENPPFTLVDFIDWASIPLSKIPLFKDLLILKYSSKDAALVVSNRVSDLCLELSKEAGTSKNISYELESKKIRDFKDQCRKNIDKYELVYSNGRTLMVKQPVLKQKDLIKKIDKLNLSSFSKFFLNEVYVPLSNIERPQFKLCPRCKYIQKFESGSYICNSPNCDNLISIEGLHDQPIFTIPREEVFEWVMVDSGTHKYTTIPGIWEVRLAEELEKKYGAKTFLYPKADIYDIYVKFPNGVEWAIDLKDWSIIGKHQIEELKKVRYQGIDTFIVFPDYKKIDINSLRTGELSLKETKGVQIKLYTEISKEAEKVKNA